MARVDPYRNFQFLVQIDGFSQAGFSECSGLASEIAVIEYREGGEPTSVRKLPGRVSFHDITLKRGVTNSREFYDWHLAGLQGQVDRRNVAIILLDEAATRWPAGGSIMHGLANGKGRISTPRQMMSP